MSYVHGTSRIFNHCIFQWYERQTDGERIAQVEPYHCERCIAELRRSAKIEGMPLRWPAGTQPPPPARTQRMVPPIVLAEDDEECRDAMATILREDGYSVTPVGNGKEALAALLEVGDPCLLLLDLRMPILSGRSEERRVGKECRSGGSPQPGEGRGQRLGERRADLRGAAGRTET